MKKIIEFFKRAFQDMKGSARAQHEVDKANFNATRAEARATWEEAKMSPRERQALIQRQREEQILSATKRTAEANERIELVRRVREGNNA